jgi:CHAT domain-containing protein/tetratricopeptide (TPR) repeat protein
MDALGTKAFRGEVTMGTRTRLALMATVLAIGTSAGYGQDAPSVDEIKTWLKEAEGLQKQGQAAKAAVVLERALGAARKRFGEEAPNTATVMHRTATAYRLAGESAKAEPLLRRCLEIREAKVGKDHADTGRTLNDLALVCQFLKRPKEAEPLFRRALAICEAKLDRDHLSTGIVLSNLADLLKALGRYAEAEPLYRRSLAIREVKQGADHLDTATCLHNLAYVCHLMIRYSDAEPHYRRSLQIREAKLGKDHALVAAVLYDFANLYSRMGRLGDAEPLMRRSLEIREAKLGADHGLTHQSVLELGALYAKNTRFAEAEALYKRTLELREAKAGKDHPATAQSLAVLADLYSMTDRYDEAERLMLRALAIQEAKFGKDHLTTATSLQRLANLYASMGRFADEEPLIRRCVAIREAKLGKDHPDLASALTSLAMLHRTLGRYGDAEPLLQRGLEIRQTKLGRNHFDTGVSLNHLASLYRQLGRHREAEQLFRRALQIAEDTRGKDHPQTARAADSLAWLLVHLRRYQEAEALFRRSLEIREAKLGKDHVEVSWSLQALGRLHRSTNRSGDAEPFLRRALEIHEAKRGADHPTTANMVTDLAMLKVFLGRDEEAEPFFRRSLEIREAKLGKDHPTTTWSLVDLAALYTSVDRAEDAHAMFDRARRATRRYVIELLPTLSAKEQRTYLTSQSAGSSMALSMALRYAPKHAAIAESGAAWLANAKAMQHEVQALSAQLEDDDPAARPVAARLRNVRQMLAKLKLEPAKDGQQAEQRRKMSLLEAEDRQLTAQLGKLGGRTGRGSDWFELAAIRRSLPAGGVLIDVARHGVFDFQKSGKAKWNPAHYVAWVTPREGAVRVVDLGEAAAIDALVAAVQKELPLAAERVRDLGEAEAEKVLLEKTRPLAQKLLEPLLALDEVAYARQWVLSPESNLWLVPWAALPLPAKGANKYVVETRVLRFVTAGRDVARGIERQASLGTAAPLIIADPDFDLGRSEAARLAQQTLGGATSQQTRSLLSDGLNLGRVRRLPGTAAEAELIAPRITELSRRTPDVFVGGKAVEAVLKSARRPQMLIVSTHGFFLGEQELKQQAEADVRSADGDSSSLALLRKDGKLFEEPLLRCGLLLAACNDQPKPGETRPGDDGVLTGLEVMGLDLRGCELVVLSACETGLGDVRNGEGVAGLRQAFQLAGAESVLSSLWKVPDRETAQLMIGLFDKLSAGKDRATALAQTQRELIRRHRQRNDAAHPFFWAAFTLTGQESQAR